MIRIYFVEDDAILMSNMRRSLSVMRRHWDMRFFSTAEDAVLAMAERPFDVLVTDMSLPGMTGDELLALTQYQYPKVVRVLLASRDDVSQTVRGAGIAHRVVAKPCDPAELAIAVQRVFEVEQRLSDPDLQTMISEVSVLPTPTQSVTQLNDLMTRDEVTVAQVAEVVSSDVNMTAKLLQLVNSAYFSLDRQITEVREAISYLGMNTVQSLCVALELMRTFENVPVMVQSLVDELHDRSLTVAHFARDLVDDPAKRGEAYVAGLLHDVGLFVIAAERPELLIELRIEAMRTSLPLTEFEGEIIGAHHADIGAFLLDLWGLPYEIVEAVARHHDAADIPGSSVDVMHAVYIADALCGCPGSEVPSDWENSAQLDDAYLESLGVRERVAMLFDAVSL